MTDENLNQNKTQTAQQQASQPTQKFDANGKPIKDVGLGGTQKPLAPTADKNRTM